LSQLVHMMSVDSGKSWHILVVCLQVNSKSFMGYDYK